MHLLFDSKSVQVIEQQRSRTRLNTLLGAIHSAGTSLNDPWVVAYSDDRITKDQLKGVQVLVILTRDPAPHNGFTSRELEDIVEYVNGGGNLLLMTSHPPNFVNDAPLASRFGVTLQPDLISNPEIPHVGVNAMVMSKECLNPALEDSLLFQVRTLIAHDSCEIVGPRDAISIATFPPTAVVLPSGKPPAHKNFAIALPNGSGKVIVAGNSGMIGDYGSLTPACGLAPLGNNLLFFLGCIRYLAGLPTPKYVGLCPGQATMPRQPAPNG